MAGAWDGVVFDRTQMLVRHPDLPLPVAIDLLRAHADHPVRYDLPLHFNGHIMTVGFETSRNLMDRPVLGDAAGYQHLWVDGVSSVADTQRSLTWLLDGRFYTYRFAASAPSQALLVESGANDPDFNLRREPALIQRTDGRTDVSFFSVLEPHGRYDGTVETVTGADSHIASIHHGANAGADVVVLTLTTGAVVAIGLAADSTATAAHRVTVDGQTYQWSGTHARFDR